MNMRTLIGVTGAAALAFGSAAHALKIDGGYSVTYAKETLRKAVSTGDATTHTVAGVTYHVLEPSHSITGAADITANSADDNEYEVIFTLENMVFSAAVENAGLTATVTDASGRTAATFTKIRGGAVEDNFVVFNKSSGQGIKADDDLTLTAEFAVTGDGPGGITRMVSNSALPANLPNIKVKATRTNSDAVKVMRALKETVTLPTTMPKADAADGFMSFTGGTSAARKLRTAVGTLTIGVESGIRDARVASDSVDQTPTNVDDKLVTLTGLPGVSTNAGIVASGDLDDASDTLGSAVTFSGEFSFVKTLALSAATDCAGSLTELRKPSKDDRTVLTDATMPKVASEFTGGMTLCVAVDGKKAIPKTDAYMATTEYKGPATVMFPAAGATHNLSMIGRSGATFRLPFLTVNERHNQRINIVNRGGDTTYTLGELATVGDSVSALSAASGDLPQGQTALKVSDLIGVTGGSRASGTLSMPADSSSIDVSVDIVNRDNGTIDTVYVDAE